MLREDQVVRIRSTPDLPTAHSGSKGTVFRIWRKYPNFYNVLVHDTGEVCVFHETQLSPKKEGSKCVVT